MEIRIRHEDSAESSFLHDGTLSEALELVAHMRLIGVVDQSGNVSRNFEPKFVITEDGAHYEIVVADD